MQSPPEPDARSEPPHAMELTDEDAAATSASSSDDARRDEASPIGHPLPRTRQRAKAPPRVSDERKGRKRKTPSHRSAGWAVLDRRLEEATYEIEVDPYRGVCARTQEERNRSPWFRSCGSRQPCGAAAEDDLGDSNDDREQALQVVRFTSQSLCPTLLRWTIEAQRKERGKRRRKRNESPAEETVVVGVRPRDPNYVCECDHNLFCLATLGGVMNDLLIEKAQILQNARCSPLDSDESSVVWEQTPSVSLAPRLSEPTKRKLSKIRDTLGVPQSRMEQYWKPLLDGLMPLDVAIRTVRRSHRNIIFDGRTDCWKQPKPGDESLVQMAVPPGIHNLGATCYLNTQIQCLAQNLEFARGIFTWRPTRPDDRMSNVISLFQQLLAELRVGGQKTCSALEWASALGLDHGEQQDPNEFSRLLFARMADAFHAERVEDGNNNLATLLSDLFQGTVVYETKCLKCGTISRRKEEFEDMNLPIEKPPQTKRRTFLSAFLASTKKFDTDLQYCLERYCQEERMDGDNQYFCSVCDAKQDATRRTVFEKLPPCLNVQLCRYVYDRSKGEKKKLADKVLLPTELRVESGSGDGIQQNRYLLCAIMRHKGTSAYRGHYVADVMDWLTGQWFEFNDESVSHLESFPLCCFNPNAGSDDSSSDESKVKCRGSDEAYSMYYVEKQFLAQSVFEHLRGMKGESNKEISHSALDLVSQKRDAEYAELARLCDKEDLEFRNTEKKRAAIRALFQGLEYVSTRDEPFVLLDARVLMRYLSCDERLISDVSSKGRTLMIHSEECCHGLMHPRTVRQGKLLPRRIYNRLLAIMCSDINEEANTHQEEHRVCHTHENIFCRECSNIHVSKLRSTLEQLRGQRLLLDYLGNEACDPDHTKDESQENAFIVAKSFEKLFRAHMNQLSSSLNDPSLEGVDVLDASSVCFSVEQDSVGPENNGSPDINESITCRHGRCHAKRGAITLVSSETWARIVFLFPNTTCHKADQSLLSGSSTAISDYLSCPLCREESDAEKQTRQRLKDIFKSYRASSLNFDVLNWKELEVQEDSNVLYFALHERDLTAWKKFCSSIQRCEPRENESLEFFCKRLLAPRTATWMPRLYQPLRTQDRALVERVFSFFRPILCQRHGSPIDVVSSGQSRVALVDRFKQGLSFLPENDYKTFLVHAVAAVMVMSSDGPMDDRDGNLDKHDAIQFIERLGLWHTFHPSLQPSMLMANQSESPSDAGLGPGRFGVANCQDQQCMEELAKWVEGEDGPIDSEMPNKQDNTGRGQDDPILLDSDEEKAKGSIESFMLRVFEAAPGSKETDILRALDQCMAWGVDESTSTNNLLRRSTRKRKTRYPVGAIVEEDLVPMSMKNNVAALRLCFMERCTNGSVFDLSHRIVLIVRPSRRREPVLVDVDVEDASTESDALLIALPFGDNVMTLLELCRSSLGELLSSESFDPTDAIAAIRMPEIDPSFQDVSKDLLMDHLIDLSNVATAVNAGSTVRQPVAERGFAGTFLSSAPADSSEPKDPSGVSVAPAVPSKCAEANRNSPIVLLTDSPQPDRSRDSPEVPTISRVNIPSRPKAKDLGLASNASVLESLFDLPPQPLEDSSSSSSDSMDDLLGTTVPRRKHARANSFRKEEDEDDDVVDADPSTALALEVLELMRETFEIKHDGASLEAAMWAARESNLQGEVDARKLLDVAYCKYLEQVPWS